MHIQIESIEPVSERKFAVRIRLGDDVVVCHVTEVLHDDLQGFNCDEPFFAALLHYGLGGMFNRDYWAFRDCEGKPFPWDYGDHRAEIVEIAVKRSGTSLDSLR